MSSGPSRKWRSGSARASFIRPQDPSREEMRAIAQDLYYAEDPDARGNWFALAMAQAG
jgi:hypothetical protein